MKKLFIFLFIVATSVVAVTDDNITLQELEEAFNENQEKIKDINERIGNDNIWIKRFQDHQEYTALKNEKKELRWKIRVLKKNRKSKKEIKKLEVELTTLNSKLDLLGEIGKEPYAELIKVDTIPPAPDVTNPFSIITAFSYESELKRKEVDYNKRLATLIETISQLNEKKDLTLTEIDFSESLELKTLKQSRRTLKNLEKTILELTPVLEIFSTSVSVYKKKSASILAELDGQLETETIKGIKILVFLGFLFGVLFFVKIVVKNTVDDTDRVFNIYRALNISTFIIVFFTLSLNYISNVEGLITILGFVSAGIAIAMKDWFMNILGYFVIVLGGSIHVGDRIKITKDGHEYVGDVLEISLTKVTFFEDITLTSYDVNRRTGRVVIFPNNFIFDSIILNYTFSGLKTVWDGIDIVVTFDSNHKKAMHLAKEIVRKYSKGYTDITRKQVNELRGKYHIRNFNPDPRVFTFIEEYGVKVSAWYLTNSYSTLTLRSTISAEIVESFREADDITIAYPSQTIALKGNKPQLPNELKGSFDSVS
ncbi:MAG: mechanosensitive ion channel [Campylobacterales bacterium]|nr:mechanosensitive ion channel [Campylobacterales bacterium]